MRLSLDPRARRLLARVPRLSWFAASELLLLVVLAWALARLLWAVATPVDPLGDWRPAAIGAEAGRALGGFDPFFRLAPDAATAVVTALDLKLYGVRSDQATGRGSAIVGLPDGTQASFAVGEEVVPGVRLDAVRFDGVTILRGGAREQLFLDQSTPAINYAPPPAGAGPAPPVVAGPPPSPAPGFSPQQLQSEITGAQRMQNGRIDGFTLTPRGSGEAFRAAGLQPGDVLLAVNGSRMSNPESMAGIPDMLAAGGSPTLEVERGGRTVVLTVGK